MHFEITAEDIAVACALVFANRGWDLGALAQQQRRVKSVFGK
jgi:hypothetical protein